MLRLLLIALTCLCATGFVYAEEDSQATDLEKLVIGDRLPPGGVYWDLQGEEGQLNLRFIGSRLRMYFVDAEGKIMEPTAPKALVRYNNEVLRGRRGVPQMTTLTPGPGGVYLSSPRVLPQPLRYFVWVVLKGVTNEASSTDEENPDGTQPYGQRILSGLGQ